VQETSSAAVTPASPTGGAAGYPVANVPFDAPWEWLAAGWRDLWRVWPLSLAYGAVFATVALSLLIGLFQQGQQALILSLAGGFLLLGPMLAVGLYEASRRLAAGKTVGGLNVVFVKTASPLQLAYLGVALLLLYLFWIRFGTLLFALFFGHQAFPPIVEFVPTLLTTAHGVGMLVVGTAVGAVLAVVAFALSAVSVPLLMERESDIFTAVTTSIKALVENPRAMLLWASVIAGLMSFGMATAFIGLVVAFPLVGHATWHAYKMIVPAKGNDGA